VEKVHAYLRTEIRYQTDPKGKQLIKRPNAVVHTGIADCKGLSTLAYAIMQNLGIPVVFRFISQATRPKQITHVYVMADGLPLDACLPTPFAEPPRVMHLDLTHLDKDMTQIAEIGKLHAVGCDCQKPKTYSFQIAKPMNAYEAEIQGLFSKKEGGTKVGNFLRKVKDSAEKAIPKLEALPIPGAKIAAKVLRIGTKVYNVVDKATGQPKAIPLPEKLQNVETSIDTMSNALRPQEIETTNTGTATGTTKDSGNSMLVPLLALAFAGYTFMKK
jgi:hypothetical protein